MFDTQSTDNLVISQIKQWVLTFIVANNFCPFAGTVMAQNSIRYHVYRDDNIAERLQGLIDECIRLDSHPEVETSLLIYPDGLELFDDYLDFLELAQDLLIAQSYEGVYQLASFHPDYCFDGLEPDDPANFTNRSPYPMLHILREASLERALQAYPDPENIPERNIALTRQLGADKLQALLTSCLQHEKK